MKMRALFSAVLLGTMFLSHAQTKPVPQAPKPLIGKDSNMNADGSLTLTDGRLAEVVAEIERRIPYWTQKQGDDGSGMPNIVYGPGAYDAIVPTPIRLRQVSPVQALALAAAAAGCSLETIFAPVEKTGEIGALGGSSKLLPIIGYRIVLASASISSPHRELAEDAGPLAGVGLALADKDLCITHISHLITRQFLPCTSTTYV